MTGLATSPWTDEHQSVLKTLVESGIAYSAIVVKLNATCGTVYTRNACIGRAKRQGLISPTREPAPRKPRNRTGEKKSTANKGHHHKVRRIVGNQFYESVSNAEGYTLRCVEIIPLNLTLAEITDDQCHYIPGDDHLYCGHPKMAGSPLTYCVPHHYLMWVKPTGPAPKARVYYGTDFARGAA